MVPKTLTTDIIIKEAYSFKEWRYINILREDTFLGPHLHKAYTINSDDAATGLLKGVYTSLPQRRLQVGKHRIVPYPDYPNEYVLGADRSDRSRQHLATWRGNVKSNRRLRQALVDQFSNKEHFNVQTTASWLDHDMEEKLAYVDLILSGKFSLCPGGWAPISFRVYESMALGVAPVVIADQCVLPDGPNWAACRLRLPGAHVHTLNEFLGAHESEFEERGSCARAEWETYFSPQAAPGYYAQSLLDCMQDNVHSCTLGSEIARMTSYQTYSSNGWTLAQRVLNRLKKMRGK